MWVHQWLAGMLTANIFTCPLGSNLLRYQCCILSGHNLKYVTLCHHVVVINCCLYNNQQQSCWCEYIFFFPIEAVSLSPPPYPPHLFSAVRPSCLLHSPQRHQFACFLQPTQQVSLTRTKTLDSPAAWLFVSVFGSVCVSILASFFFLSFCLFWSTPWRLRVTVHFLFWSANNRWCYY